MKQAKTLDKQEIRRVLDHISTRKHAARNRAMLLMTHLAGMRVGEVAALRWGDVLNSTGQIKNEIRLSADQTKGNDTRTVVISERLQKELAVYVKSQKVRDMTHSFFYTQKQQRRGFTANTLAQHFYHLYKAAGIDGASSHSGRRSLLTNLGSKGVTLTQVAETYGTSTLQIEKRTTTLQKQRSLLMLCHSLNTNTGMDC